MKKNPKLNVRHLRIIKDVKMYNGREWYKGKVLQIFEDDIDKDREWVFRALVSEGYAEWVNEEGLTTNNFKATDFCPCAICTHYFRSTKFEPCSTCSISQATIDEYSMKQIDKIIGNMSK
jgi:hypothetical protein